MNDTEKLEDLMAKLEWEGWPDGLEWFGGARFEDERVQSIVDEALDLHIRLDALHRELEAIAREGGS